MRPFRRIKPAQHGRASSRRGLHYWLLAVVLLTHQGAGGADESAHGLLPLPDYSGDLATRPTLTGDWGGARSDLARQGLTFDLAFTQVLQGVVSGGLDRATAYGGKLDFVTNFDLNRAGVLPGALLTLRAESRYGESINQELGTALPVNDVLYFPLTSPADEDILLTISELRCTQFLSPQVGLFVGKITTLGGDSNEFAGGRGDTQFLAHAFTSASVTSLFNPAPLVAG